MNSWKSVYPESNQNKPQKGRDSGISEMSKEREQAYKDMEVEHAVDLWPELEVSDI
jgi:hypothetical protein